MRVGTKILPNFSLFWIFNSILVLLVCLSLFSYNFGLVREVSDVFVHPTVFHGAINENQDYILLAEFHELGALDAGNVLIDNAILDWLESWYLVDYLSSDISNFVFGTIPFWFIKFEIGLFTGRLELFWIYLIALMFFFSVSIYFNYRIKSYNIYPRINSNSINKKNIRIELQMEFIRGLCNAWLFCNFIFIVLFCIQFDFISTGVFIAGTINGSDLFVCFFKIFLLFSYSMFLIIFRDFTFNQISTNEYEIHFLKFEFLILTGFFIFGSLVLLSSQSFIEVFLALEIQSYSLYILAGSDRNRILSAEAGLKYFIFGSFSSLIGLLGIAILYFETGFLDLQNVFLYIAGDFSYNLCGLGVMLFLLNFFFKLGIFPFHFWMPDVFYGSHLLYTIFFASISKIAPFSFFVYFCSSFLAYLPEFSYLLFFVSVCSIVIGSISAFGQNSIKKLIGYSSISNLGFCCLILANDFSSVASIVYSVGYFVIYIFTMLSFFTVISCVQLYYTNEQPRKYFQLDKFEDLSVLSLYFLGPKNFFSNVPEWKFNRNIFPYFNLSFFFIIFVFSFAGIPPFLGFYAKFFIFQGLIESNFFFNLDFSLSLYLFLYFLLFFVILMAFYYLRLIKYSSFLSINGKGKRSINLDKLSISSSKLKILKSIDKIDKGQIACVGYKGSSLAIIQILFSVIFIIFGFACYDPFYDFILYCVISK